MDITKAEAYLSERLEKLSDERMLLEKKLNKNNMEIKELDSKKIILEDEVDKAFDVFSPRTGKNDVIRREIEKLKKHKDELALQNDELVIHCKELEKDICTIRDMLDATSKDNEGKSEDDMQNSNDEEIYGLKILESQEEERKRIARDLHDSTVQVLTNLVHKCEICMKIVDVDPVRAKLELEIMSKTLRDAIGEIRNIIYDLRPMSFDDLGLNITLERAVKSIDAGTDMNVNLKIEGEKQDLSGIVQLTIFRIVQECANNSIKYSKGNNLNIKVIYEEKSVVLEIDDDGVGFDYEENASSDDGEHTGFGLNMMRERVALLSGFIDIETTIGNGTAIKVSIPVA